MVCCWDSKYWLKKKKKRLSGNPAVMTKACAPTDSRTDVSLDVTGDVAVWAPVRVDILKCDPTAAQSGRSSATVEEV